MAGLQRLGLAFLVAVAGCLALNLDDKLASVGLSPAEVEQQVEQLEMLDEQAEMVSRCCSMADVNPVCSWSRAQTRPSRTFRAW